MMKNLRDWLGRITLLVAIFMVTGAPGKAAQGASGAARAPGSGGTAGGGGGAPEAAAGVDIASMFPYIVVAIAVVALVLAALLSKKKNASQA